MRRKGLHLLAVLVALLTATSVARQANALTFDGIDFPQGASSFADTVIRYDPLFNAGPGPSDPDFMDSASALGTPDFASNTGAVTLGRGGLIELGFVDNLLTNSGSGMQDLHIFEIGGDVEDTFVAIRPTAATFSLIAGIGTDANNDGFFEIGGVGGATSSIDLDAFFPGFAAGALQFDAVQLVDDWNEGDITGITVGADIDAVGAITSQTVVVPPTASTPEPATAALGLLATLGLATMATRRRKV